MRPHAHLWRLVHRQRIAEFLLHAPPEVVLCQRGVFPFRVSLPLVEPVRHQVLVAPHLVLK